MPFPRLLRTLSCLSLLSLAAVFPLAAQEPEPVGAQLDELHVVETVDYDFEHGGGSLLSVLLSADGEQLLNVNRGEFCVYTAAGAEVSCAGLQEIRYDPASLRWSPDGRYVAFVDDRPFINFRDSDIWVLDTQTGIFTNLTDDGDLPSILDTIVNDDLVGPFAPIDLAPRFSADGQLYFLRIEQIGTEIGGTLYRIPASGGSAEQLAVLTPNVRGDGYPYDWDIAPDGQTGVYVIGTSRQDTLRRVDLATGNTVLLHTIDRETEVGVASIEFSPRGDVVLWHSQALARLRGTDEGIRYAFLTTLNGETFPASISPFATYFGWSFDGTALAYTVYDPQNPDRNGLYLGLPGKEGQRIATADDPEAPLTSTRFPVGMFWGANNTILLAEGFGQSVFTLWLGTE